MAATYVEATVLPLNIQFCFDKLHEVSNEIQTFWEYRSHDGQNFPWSFSQRTCHFLKKRSSSLVEDLPRDLEGLPHQMRRTSERFHVDTCGSSMDVLGETRLLFVFHWKMLTLHSCDVFNKLFVLKIWLWKRYVSHNKFNLLQLSCGRSRNSEMHITNILMFNNHMQKADNFRKYNTNSKSIYFALLMLKLKTTEEEWYCYELSSSIQKNEANHI